MTIGAPQPARKSFFSVPIVLLLLFPFLLWTRSPMAQNTEKVVQGRVIGAGDKPQTGAIVYLKNEKTNDIKSFISTSDGSYRFGQLHPDIDYEIWAEYQGRRSPTKTVSSFDSKKILSYDLKVDRAK